MFWSSRIHEQMFQFSRIHEPYFLFSRITNEIVFTNSRTTFFIFTNSRTKKSQFPLARTPLGGPLYMNGVFSAQPQIFLSSISNFSYLQPTLPDFYVLKMIVSILCFILNTYLYPHTALSSFLKNLSLDILIKYPEIYSYKK